MLVTKNEQLRTQVLDSIRETILKERSGVHLSELIYCPRKAYFRRIGLAPKPDDNLCILWMTGYAFQAYMFPKDEEITEILDGISCTPDIHRGIEVKSTRRSSKYFDFADQESWKVQILGYCKVLGKLEYDLVVFFVCGNYAPPFPTLECWHIVATQEEVDETWAIALRRKDNLILSLLQNVLPQPDCFDWEWEYCECIDQCQDAPCYRKKQLKGNKREKK